VLFLQGAQANRDGRFSVATPLLLREVGFATGEALYEGFDNWARTHYHVDSPRALQPVVFTNVEAFHRLARLSRPAPLLGLMRAPSDETAAEQAAELDGLQGAAG